jgi:GntR family transcriptional regulator / MocR family aminotransferase
MPKRVKGVAEADVTLDSTATAPLYRQLYERLRAEILAGQLEAGGAATLDPRARQPSGSLA